MTLTYRSLRMDRDESGTDRRERSAALHDRAARIHAHAAQLHRLSANLHEGHAVELAGSPDSARRAHEIADRERLLEQHEETLADQNRDQAATARGWSR